MNPEEVDLNMKGSQREGAKTFEKLKSSKILSYDHTLKFADSQGYGKGTVAQLKSVKSVMINAVDKPNYEKVKKINFLTKISYWIILTEHTQETKTIKHTPVVKPPVIIKQEETAYVIQIMTKA